MRFGASKAIFAATIALAGTATMIASSPIATAIPKAAPAAPACRHYSASHDYGKAYGMICGNHVTGFEQDTKADGRCVYTIAYSEQGNAVSGWACPKGDKKTVDITAPGDVYDADLLYVQVSTAH